MNSKINHIPKGNSIKGSNDNDRLATSKIRAVRANVKVTDVLGDDIEE